MAAFAPRVIAQKTKFVAVALAILALAFVMQIIAIATPWWLKTPDVHAGLFFYCGFFTTVQRTRSLKDCKQMEALDIPTSLQAVRILCVFSIALTLTSFITGCCHLWTVVRHEKINIKYALASAVSSIVAVLLTLVAAILFGGDTRTAMPRVGMMVNYDLSHSFALFVVSGIFTVVGAIIIIFTLRSLTKLLLV